MGDIYPYGPPRYPTAAAVTQRLIYVGFTAAQAAIGLAIGKAESGLDMAVINDTPATGDYSVGIWQINYYGSLYAGRTAEFGTPKYLVTDGLNAQTYACRKVYLSQGWSAWSTFTSGAYLPYLNGNPAPVTGEPGGPRPPDTNISPPTEDYSATIRYGAESWRKGGVSLQNASTVLGRLRSN